RLSSDDERIFQSIFPPVMSEEEITLRIPAYLVALNFTVAEMRSENPLQATQEKVKYLDKVFKGEIPLMR
ncbi:MAG: hypothetical protein M1426_00775, partial [Patescibacteria group bacterium]|nr:hypothetical protein [Patescibacteria group bacterium]